MKIVFVIVRKSFQAFSLPKFEGAMLPPNLSPCGNNGWAFGACFGPPALPWAFGPKLLQINDIIILTEVVIGPSTATFTFFIAPNFCTVEQILPNIETCMHIYANYACMHAHITPEV